MKIFIPVVITILMGCGSGDKESKEPAASPQETEKKEPTKVKVTSLTPENFVESGQFFGSVQGIKQAVLISYSGGSVKKVFKKDGDRVKAGEPLCNIESESYSNIYKAAKIQEKLAKENLERSKKHKESEHYAQIQVDKAEQAFHQARNQTLQAKKNWESSRCQAPFSGIVIKRNINQYENLNPGTPTFELANLNKVKVVLAVPENEIQGYKRNSKVKFLGEEKELTGKIYSISQKVDATNKTFSVEVHLNNKSGQLKPGQLVQVEVEKKTWEEAVVIPSEIIQSLQKGSAVYVVEENKAKQVMIEQGPNLSGRTLITSGLNPGDQLIVSGYALVSDGSEVKVINN